MTPPAVARATVHSSDSISTRAQAAHREWSIDARQTVDHEAHYKRT